MVADVPGPRASQLVPSELSALLSREVRHRLCTCACLAQCYPAGWMRLLVGVSASELHLSRLAVCLASQGEPCVPLGSCIHAACLETELIRYLRWMQSNGLAAAANMLWDLLAANSTTAGAARRMLAHAQRNPARQASCIGRTAWNAYAYN